MEKDRSLIAENQTKFIDGREVDSQIVVSYYYEKLSMGPSYGKQKQDEIFRLHINYLDDLIEVLQELKEKVKKV